MRPVFDFSTSYFFILFCLNFVQKSSVLYLGSMKTDEDGEGFVPLDLYYLLYEYMPPGADAMGPEYPLEDYPYQYLNPHTAAGDSAYNYEYPIYADAAALKPDYAVRIVSHLILLITSRSFETESSATFPKNASSFLND